jgi:pantoate--beta-alanine ligase
VAELAIVRTVADLRARVAAWRHAGHGIGLVPTMGALHEGHLALVRRSLADGHRTLATIFVNPAQFGPGEDLASYPRDEAGDASLLARTGAQLLFAPELAEIYRPGHLTTVAVSGLGDHLCGPFRPGHFEGVATIVTKLLNLARPDAAYFGEKDYQQLQVIRRLARDLDFAVSIVGVETVREADGLALSSRNRYLSPTERAIAAQLPRLMTEIAARLRRDPAAVAASLAWGRDELLRLGFAAVDYLTLADAETLAPVGRLCASARLFAAAWVGRTRLIDNLAVD